MKQNEASKSSLMTQTEINCLKRLRNLVSRPLDGKMNFGAGFECEPLTLKGEPVDATEFINKATDLWRRSWLTPVIDALIAKGEGRATQEDLRTLDVTARNP